VAPHPAVVRQESVPASSPKFRLASLLRKAKAVNAFQRLQLVDALDPQADTDPGERPIPLDGDVDSGLWECTGELVRVALSRRRPSRAEGRGEVLSARCG
jgi:hypothetical protein